MLLCGCFGNRVVARVVAMRLLGYPEWLLRCCYAAAKLPESVAKVLQSGC